MSKYRSTKDIAATVRETLKQELPQWKFSVRYESYSGGSAINLALMEGPEEVIVGYAEERNQKQYGKPDHAQLNHYNFIGAHSERWKSELNSNGYILTPKGWEVMESATRILFKEHWDRSEIQTDYFCCAFYAHVNIGKWDRPYKVVVK